MLQFPGNTRNLRREFSHYAANAKQNLKRKNELRWGSSGSVPRQSMQSVFSKLFFFGHPVNWPKGCCRQNNRLCNQDLRSLIRPFPLAFIFVLLNLSLTYGQGTLRGKITDDKGEEIVGATIVLKSYPTIGTITDLSGNFSLRINDPSPQVISISYVSYNSIEDEVNPKNGEVIIRNYTMLPATINLDDVVITARAKRANDNYMRVKKFNSPVSLDYISRETIKKTGDSQIDDAVKRVTGVSMIGGYITVRGLADRYIKTTINGARIPTLDPLTNNIKLDMFPTSLVDNIVINKSTSPDLPGDWAGSYLSIETKDYPDKLMISIKSTFGYNKQSSFTDVLSTQRSPTDWLGFDNGFREIKHFEVENFPYYSRFTSPYDEFSVLGLDGYLDMHGIIQDNLPAPGNTNRYYAVNNMYYRMGLVELGLLAPGLIYDDKAVRSAIDEYYNNPDLKDRTHLLLSSDAITFNQSLPDNWITLTRNRGLDFSQDISIGNQISLFGNPLGFLAGFRYSNSMRYDPATHRGVGFFSQNPATQGEFIESISHTRQRSTETNQWSALLNLAYKLNSHNTLSIMVMPNFTGVNNASLDSGYNHNAFVNTGLLYEIIHRQYYEERKQTVYQFQSNHFIPGPGIKLEFNASFTDGQSNTPDFKNYDFGMDEGTMFYRFKQADMPNRVYRYLDEDILDTRFSVEIPVFEKPGISRKIKLGGAYLENTLSNRQYNYLMSGGFDNALRFETKEALLNYTRIDNFSTIENHELVHYYQPLFRSTDFNKGYSKVISGFGMADLSLHRNIRLSGGIRVEKTDIYTDVLSMFDKGIPPFHSSRKVELPGYSVPIYANPSNRDETNYLPSLNLVYKVLSTEKTGMNARFGYSNTIGRPSIRELSSYYDFNYTLSNNVLGNPDLKMVYITNYDLRLETFFASGDNFSLSFFNKQFENHIELGNENNVYTWRNAPGVSTANGIEVEGKKVLFKNLELMGNVTFVKSKAIVMAVLNGIVIDTISRDMYGQAPYIANTMLTYTREKSGISATLSYNVQGPKLAFVTITNEQPDVYEMPRHMVDFKISKSIGKNFSMELKIRDILSTRNRWAYNFNNYSVEYEGYNYGTNYSFSISYDL